MDRFDLYYLRNLKKITVSYHLISVMVLFSCWSELTHLCIVYVFCWNGAENEQLKLAVIIVTICAFWLLMLLMFSCTLFSCLPILHFLNVFFFLFCRYSVTRQVLVPTDTFRFIYSIFSFLSAGDQGLPLKWVPLIIRSMRVLCSHYSVMSHKGFYSQPLSQLVFTNPYISTMCVLCWNRSRKSAGEVGRYYYYSSW